MERGERTVRVNYGGKYMNVYYFVTQDVRTMLGKRASFIAGKQPSVPRILGLPQHMPVRDAVDSVGERLIRPLLPFDTTGFESTHVLAARALETAEMRCRKLPYGEDMDYGRSFSFPGNQ